MASYSAGAIDGVATDADANGPAQIAYATEGARGPVVLLISGQTGPNSCKPYAVELARLGFYTVLVDGKDIPNRAQRRDAPIVQTTTAMPGGT